MSKPEGACLCLSAVGAGLLHDLLAEAAWEGGVSTSSAGMSPSPSSSSSTPIRLRLAGLTLKAGSTELSSFTEYRPVSERNSVTIPDFPLSSGLLRMEWSSTREPGMNSFSKACLGTKCAGLSCSHASQRNRVRALSSFSNVQMLHTHVFGRDGACTEVPPSPPAEDPPPTAGRGMSHAPHTYAARGLEGSSFGFSNVHFGHAQVSSLAAAA
mmetsp:Transcript_19333/g.39740  ORF Transcript_19333/g.39740 Transcript_19333/m.39740 type:complete len:212 (-) Transcript_19333:228-863(-)